MENIFIIIPTLDPDEKIMSKFINELQQEFKHILVVNDGSSIEHKKFFENLEKQGIEIFTHDINYGKGRTVKNAFNYIINKYPNIKGSVTADCDGQHAVKDIKCVAEALLEHQESLILGIRNFDKDNVPFKSRLGNIFAKKMFKLILGVDISDTQTGLRGFGKNLMSKFINIPGERYEFETNMLVNCDQYYIEIVEIPIETIYINSNAKSHFKPLKDSIVIYHSSIKYLHTILKIKKRRDEKMKQNEAKELLERLQENKYVDSKMLKNVLNFSDRVLEKLNSVDDEYLCDTCKILLLYNNEKERLEIIQLIMQINNAWTGDRFYINLLSILKNKMLRDNKVAIKHAQIFVEFSNGTNEDILYKFLTDEFFIKNNLVATFVNKICNLYSDKHINYEYVLNIIKEKYNDANIDTYIKLLNEPDKSVAVYAYNFIMNNTNNKDLFVNVIKENEQFFRKESLEKKGLVYRFFKIASNNNFTKDEVNKGIKLISKYYYNCFEEENLLNVLGKRRFKEVDEIVSLGVVNSGKDVLSIANLDSNIYEKVIYILKNYSEYINVTLKCVREMEKELEELEYILNIILKYAKEREPKDIYNVIDIMEDGYLLYDNLNIVYCELYIAENNSLKRSIYYEIMTEISIGEYKKELINMIKPIHNYYLLQILRRYMATIEDEKELLELFKILVKFDKMEDLNEEESYIVSTLTESVIEEYNKYELDKEAKDIRNYLLNGLMGLNNEEFLKENYDVIYNWLYEAMMLKKYENFNEVKKVIKAKFNITIETEKEAHENKIELVNDLINSMENKEEVNIRKLAKKNK